MSKESASALPPLTTRVQYAVVAYLEGELARFVEGLRKTLNPEDAARAHLTILPPRPLSGSPDEALASLQSAAAHKTAFEVLPAEVSTFEDTQVIKLSIGQGLSRLLELHAALNTGPFRWKEEHEYVPHITLGLDVAGSEFDQCVAIARRRWEFAPKTAAKIQTLTLVREERDESWSDVGAAELGLAPAMR
jgi:2'-5' RNA ligase